MDDGDGVGHGVDNGVGDTDDEHDNDGDEEEYYHHHHQRHQSRRQRSVLAPVQTGRGVPHTAASPTKLGAAW